jgi:2-polyprenyl-3-methyl-5-hydroxy-6-metoxy-1,4-benzoquinol methylase
MEKQVEIDQYEFSRYTTKNRWCSYWHQINEVSKINPTKVLLIGIGDWLVVDCIRRLGIKVLTLDFDEKFKPDYLGSVTDIQKILGEEKFDCILCAQVLEHIPYEKFETTIEQLSFYTDYLIVSLPNRGFKTVLTMQISKLKPVSLVLSLPQFYKKWHFDGEHYWEIGTNGYSLERVKKTFLKYYHIKNTYLVNEMPYHRFFILAK